MPDERLEVSVDVGTAKVVTLVGGVGRDKRVEIVGVGVAPSRGIRRGVVVDLEAAAEAVQASRKKAEQSSGVQIDHVVVGAAGDHILSVNTRGSVSMTRADHVITAEDMRRAISAAAVLGLPADREVISTLARAYTIDSRTVVDNPLGMVGNQLEVETHITTGSASGVRNLQLAVERFGLKVDDLYVAGYASALAALADEEKEAGVLLVDIGAGTTDLAVFMENSVWHTASLPVGGQHITNDIAITYSIAASAAEEIKLKFGHAQPASVDSAQAVELPVSPDEPRKTVPRRQVAEVIAARLEEIFELVVAEVKRSGYDGMLPAGIVITGGTANIRGIEVLARRMLGLPARIGRPAGLRGLTDKLSDPAYTTAVGLLLRGLREDDVHAVVPRSRRGGGGGLFTRITGWAREISGF